MPEVIDTGHCPEAMLLVTPATPCAASCQAPRGSAEAGGCPQTCGKEGGQLEVCVPVPRPLVPSILRGFLISSCKISLELYTSQTARKNPRDPSTDDG